MWDGPGWVQNGGHKRESVNVGYLGSLLGQAGFEVIDELAVCCVPFFACTASPCL